LRSLAEGILDADSTGALIRQCWAIAEIDDVSGIGDAALGYQRRG
jgi:hypothetical protein